MKMSDLAKLAGVSKSTVSRALADSELVNKETRDKIQALAKELQYRKDTRASNLRLKKTLTIGVLLPSNGDDDWLASNPFILEMLGAISDQLEKRGHELLLAKHSNSDPSWIKEFIQTRDVDGTIVLGQSIYHDILNDVGESYSNLVVWGAKLPNQSYVTVGSDNYKGGQIVASHLIEKGRKHFAFLGDPRCPETMLRHQGFHDALVQHDPQFEPAVLHCTERQNNTAADAITQFLATKQPLDALFTSNDMLAISAIQSLRENQLNVPGDVSVVGYDNISLAQYISPSLSSICQDRSCAGQLLVEKLFALFDDEVVESETIPTQLIVRESS